MVQGRQEEAQVGAGTSGGSPGWSRSSGVAQGRPAACGDGREECCTQVVYLGKVYRGVQGPGSAPWVHRLSSSAACTPSTSALATSVSCEDSLGSDASLGLGEPPCLHYPARSGHASSRVLTRVDAARKSGSG